MSSDSGNPSDNGVNGAAIDMAAIQKLIEEGVGKALSARLPRVKNTEETIAKMVADSMSKALEGFKPAEAKQDAGNDAGNPERQSLKSLTEEMGRLRKQLVDQQAAAEKANQAARDTRLRSEFSSKLAAKLGADSPLLGPLVDSFYDVKKRVVDDNGRVGIKFVDAYGDESVKPLDEGIAALFEGEFKHLSQPASKAAGLPPSSMVRGAPMGQQQGNAPRNPIYDEIAKSALGQNPNLAAMLTANSGQSK